MQHPVGVAVGDPGEHLIQVELHQSSVRPEPRVRVHVLFQVEVQKLENQVELGVGVDDVLQSHDVGVLEFFQQGNLPDRRRRDPFFFLLEADLLEGDGCPSCPVSRLVDDTVGPFADLLDFLVLLKEMFFRFVVLLFSDRRKGDGRKR